MSKAANDTEKGHYASAIGHYKKAWELAQKAVHDCKQKPKDKSSDDGNK